MARTTDPERHAARRNQILDAAVRCFADKGFHGTSTADICRAAGMSSGNMFHYFPTKDAVVMAIAEEDRRQTAAMFASIDPSANVVHSVIRLAEMTMAGFADPVLARLGIELAAEAARNPAMAAMFEDNDRMTKDLLRDLLDEGIRRGEVAATLEVEAAVRWLIALIEGAIGRAAMDPAFDPQTGQAMLDRLITRFLGPDDHLDQGQPPPAPGAVG